ncbi:uncharacterized protein SPSK_01224 [Sporothrix schenckii 1099-18]|uniref:N-acetyltransferase domain-containing protein n=2 Tax=Sporothrix schenckii TaxID=29908 RepID=U7PPX1_SPOS1|nr:uncharacterized protein SPSK_01224 [Sporothrix schenckii 1099-18]ERS96794.1 hypothetical protein HMPREF1624_07003 [Sporothrix schenckii ATCC 58251]KJR81523.1 hypothetical protein SPSK_01224 [Sporothrix schenckii 1099-18]
MAPSNSLVDPAITGSEASTAMHSPHPHGAQDRDATEDATSSSEADDALFVSPANASNSASAYAASAAASVAAAAAAAAANTPGVHHHVSTASPSASPAPAAPLGGASASPRPSPAASAASHVASPDAASIPAAHVQKYNPAVHSHLVLYLAALHGARITSDNLSGSFAPPLNHEKLLDWWRDRLTTSAVFLLLRSSPVSSSSAAPAKAAGPDLVGVIMLRSHPAETSPHVASVELLLVNLQYRQLGGERQLLQTVERQALLEGRTLLTAEAESKSNTASMYSALGFTEVGQIPGMVLRPSTGEKRAQSIFYKDLLRAYQQEQGQP